MFTIIMKRVLREMKFWHILVLIFMLCFIAVAPPLAHATIPRYINYQGKLTDANDDPVNDSVNITIKIYDVESGGTALWSETQSVNVTRGIFSMLLGSTTSLDTLNFDKSYWYSVEVESDGEMTPRQRLTSVAYAINSDKLGGYTALQFLRADADASLTGALTVSGNITGSANGDITLDPTGTGNIVMKIDSTSGDFKVTDGTTNWVKVDHETGNVSVAKDLTVAGTIYGTIASTGGSSTFSSLTVTGASDLRGNISNSSGAVTIADSLTQSGSSNQVTFDGNIDAGNGLDVTGVLTVNGATTLNGALGVNSNIDLNYSGDSAGLSVTQGSTGPAAQFAGQRVVIGATELTNANALSSGELYVQGDMEVDGTIYGNISSGGTTTLGATTMDSLTVTGASDLKGNISNSTGVLAIADNVTVAHTSSAATGIVTTAGIQPTYQDGGVNSTTTVIGLNIAPVINYTGATKSGSYTALKIAATETSLPTGSNYLIDAYAGTDGATQRFYVDNSGNAKIFGTLNMNSQKITSLGAPVAATDAATKAYVDSITPASAGGWTDGGTGVYLSEGTDNVGIGTAATDTYKLNVAGSANATTLYINGSQVTSTAAELNKLDGAGAGVTGSNLTTLTAGGVSNADSLHTHAAANLTGDLVSTVNDMTGDVTLEAGDNVTITPTPLSKKLTIASQASGDEVSTTSLTFTLDSDNVAAGVANGAGIVFEGGTGTDASVKFNSGTSNLDIAGVTGGLNIPTGAKYKINGSQIASSDLSDSANLPKLDSAETITGDWVNTAHPWSDDEVADDITASNYMPLAGGTMSGNIILSGPGTKITTSGIDLGLSPAAGYGLVSAVTRSAATGDEAAYDLAATINKLTSGNYTGIKLNITETSAPGAANNLLDLQVGAASKFTINNAGFITTASVNSASIVDGSLGADDLGVNVVSSVDGVTNNGGNIDLIAGSNVTITPNDTNNTITISSSYTDTVLSQEEVEDHAGTLIAAGVKTNLSVTYQDNGAGAGSVDMAVTGVPVLAPASSQTITAADTGATPLVLKGMAGQTANLFEAQDSSALSHLTVEPDGDVQIDTSGGDALGSITQTNTSASLAVATNIAKLGGGAGSDSDGVLKLGINEGNYQYIWYDTDAGTDGLGAFIFSDQAVIPTASPAYLNFGVNRNAETGRYNQYYAIKLDPDVNADSSYDKQKFSVVSIPTPGTDFAKYEKPLFDIASDGSFNIYDPTVGDAVFQIQPGGRLAHDFRNTVRNGSFEAFSGFEKFVGYDSTFSQAGAYNDTTAGYRGGWSSFAPDEWTWVEGKIVQHSPALFKTGTGVTGTFNTDFFDGKSAVAINEWSGKRNLNYAIGLPGSGNDAGIKQVISGLEPNTWYSIGAALMSTNPVTTKAILDITGCYVPATNITSGINLNAVLNGSSTSVIAVASAANFPQGGTLLIDNELFDYTGKTDTSFTGVTRAVNSTSAAGHTNNASVSGVFKPLISSSSAFVENKGSFKTDSSGSDISIYLLCQQASGANDTEFARFDAVQLVEGKVLPKYSATSITDTGDQSIYGTLKLGRSADGRGGILSVDQYVRTRGIDFFSEDPGMSGTTGGSGTVDRVPYSFINTYSTSALPKTPGYVKMDVSGNYIASVMRKFQVKVMGAYDSPGSPAYVKYRYIDCIDPMNEWNSSAWPAWTETWYPSGSGIEVTTTETDLAFGIKVKFSDTTGLQGGDQWEFKAYGMDPGQRVYDSFNKQTAYKSSETRIFRDPATGELTFEDSNAGKVRLSEIISQRSKAYISPPTRDPNNMGMLEITATGELSSSLFSSAQNFEVWTETVYDANGNPILPPTKFGWSIMWSPNSGTAGTYNWYGNWMQPMNRGSAISLVASTGQDTGIDITFPATGDIFQYERWRFFASPSTAANIAPHHHATDADGGLLGASGTTSQNFILSSALDPAEIKLGFGNGVPEKFIKWNQNMDRFEVSHPMNINGTLTAVNLSGPTSTSGTSNNTFTVDTDLAAGSTEPAQGSGFIINGGGSGNVNIAYDTTGNYLNVSGQAGPADAFTGINIPSGAKYKIGANNLSASDVGAANSVHSHVAADLPVAGAGTAGIVPAGGFTNAMVSGSAAIQTSKLQDGTAISDAITKKHAPGADTTLGTMSADINMGSNKVTNLAAPVAASDAANKTYVDNAIAGLHWKDPVSAIQATPPVGPVSGVRYIVKSSGTGAWSGQDNKIAVYNGSTWDFTAPLQSYAVFNKADNAGYVYNGSSWVAFSGATAYTWGTGLTNTGTTISVDNSVVATLSGNQTITNKTISGANNTLQNIADSSLNQITTANKVSGAAVQLNATGAITNSTGLKVNIAATNPGLAVTDNALDVKLSANQGLAKGASGMQVDYDDATIGIVGNKLAVKAGSIGSSQIGDSQVTSAKILDGAIINADVSDSAAIATSKISGAVTSIANHGLGGLAVLNAVSGGTAGTITDDTITNADIKSDAAIAQSKLNLSVTNNEIAANAAIAQSKLNLSVTNNEVAANAGIATAKISGPVTSIVNHGLGNLATLSAVSGGAGGTITDNTITDDDIKSDAGISTTKLSGSVTAITNNGLGNLATMSAVSGGAGGTITDATITTADISANAGILDSQLATSPATRFYENFAEYVETGLQPAVSVNLTSDISAGTAYVLGLRINKASATAKTYTASKDTYVDIDSSGNFQYTAVANGAEAPAVAANSIRLAKIVTDIDNITGVTDMRNLYPVTANEIAPGAVTSVGIEDGSIGTSKLADSAVTSIKIADGTIVNSDIAVNAAIDQSKLNLSITNNEVAANAAIAWAKINKSGAVPADVGAAASSHTHGGTDLSGVILTAPQSAQTIQPAADVVPLTIKGQASANSNVLSIYDAAAVPSEKMYVDKLGHMYMAEDTSTGAKNSAATLYFGRNSTDNWETMGYDPALGTKGKFTFSAPLQVEASSPTGITFVEKDAGGAIIKSQGLVYDPDADAFSFTGGTLKQAFQNLIRNPSFETSSPVGWTPLIGNYSSHSLSTAVFKFGTKSVAIKDSLSDSNLGIKTMISSYDSDWKRLQGKTITFSFWAKADSAVTTSIGFDSTGTETDYDTNNEIVPEQANDVDLTSTWQNFKFSYDVPANATKLNIILYGAEYSTSGSNVYAQNIYFDGLTLVEGKLNLDYGPSPIFDTGSQVIYGSLAIGANYDPNSSANYYESPRLVFGQPDSYFGGGYSGWSGGSGEIRFMKWGDNPVGTFMLNRGVWLRDDYGSTYGATLRIGSTVNPVYANAKGDIYAQGRLELGGVPSGGTASATLTVGQVVAGNAATQPTFATAANDAYVRGKIEADGGFYGDGSNITNINSAVQLNPNGAITNYSGLKVNVDNTTIGISSNQLALKSGYADGTVYDSRFVNASGDIITGSMGFNYTAEGQAVTLTKAAAATLGQNITEYDMDISRQLTEPASGSATWSGAVARIQNLANVSGVGALTDNSSVLELNQGSAGNTLVLKSDGTPVVTFAKTGDITLGSGADTITSASANNINLKLGDTGGVNKLSVQTSAGAEKFAVSSDGTVKIDGGYTGALGGGITLQPNGDIYFDGNMYQKGDTYTVDTVRFTGNYDVGLISKFGVGADGTDANYLQIDQDGVITKAGSGNSGAVTVNDAFVQTGSSNQAAFQGNVDALNGLDVTGNITTTGTVDGIDISSDSWVTSGKIVDGAVATTDIADSAVTSAKVGVGAIDKSKILELRPYATSPAANNKANVAAGIISISNNARVDFAGGISPAFDPVTANSRIDLLAVDSSGNLVIIPGAQAVSPTAPEYPTDKLVVAEVTITETSVQGVVISDNDIKDVRPFLSLSAGSGNSSIVTTDSPVFTIGRDTDESSADVTLAFGNTADGQKTITYTGASSDDFVFNDDISLGANSLKFTNNTLTGAKVGNYDSHLANTSNPHSVTAAQIGGTGIITEINAAGTSGTINAARLAPEVLTQSEGDASYVKTTGGTVAGSLSVTGTLTPGTIAMPAESNITWATPGKMLITPEYQNGILYGDGSNNSGTIAVKNTNDSNWRNYYEWSSQNSVLQDYSIIVRCEIPSDFSSWASANAIKLGYITEANSNSINKVDVVIYKSGSGTAVVSKAANYSTSWSEITIDGVELGQWSAGDILIIEIKVYSKNSNFARVGDITLNYNR